MERSYRTILCLFPALDNERKREKGGSIREGNGRRRKEF
jgi:hypothetical protein